VGRPVSRRRLWRLADRCSTEALDTSRSAPGLAAEQREKLREEFTLRCCHEPAAADCEACAHNRAVLAAEIDRTTVYRFDAVNEFRALEALGKIEGMFVKRKLTATLNADESLEGMSATEIAFEILGSAVRWWAAPRVHRYVDIIAAGGVVADLEAADREPAPALPATAGPNGNGAAR